MSDYRQEQELEEREQWEMSPMNEYAGTDVPMSMLGAKTPVPRPRCMVYEAITSVMQKLAKAGIAKDRKNVQQGYAFRGIDDVYNALSPFLAEAKLCILPTVLSRDCVERTTQKGNALFYVTVKVCFCFVSAEDGSRHEVVTYGEAMDSGDKATNKAMSAAYKYACMETFCIPTEGDNDADGTTHEVKAQPKHTGLPSGPISPVDGSLEYLSPAERETAKGDAMEIVKRWGEGKELGAYEVFYSSGHSNEIKMGIWECLKAHSKIRNGLKKMHNDALAATQA